MLVSLLALMLAAFPRAATVLPFRWTPGQIEVEVSVNGTAPEWFIVDSGAEYSILDDQLAQRLDLRTSPRFGQPFSHGVSLRIGEVELRDQDVMIMPLESFRRQKRAIVGLLGYDLFAYHVVTIDYAARILTVRDPRGWRASPKARSIPLAFAGRLATVPVTIAVTERERIAARVTLDTGAAQTLILRHPFAKSHGLPRRAASSTQAGGLQTATVTFAKLPVTRVTLEGFSLEHPTLRMYTSSEGAGGDTETDGAMGNEILRRFTVVGSPGTELEFAL